MNVSKLNWTERRERQKVVVEAEGREELEEV